jgi:hypothetical protein
VQLGIAEAVFCQCTDLEILDEDVALGDQAKRDVLALGFGDVERDGSFVTIDAHEIGTFFRPWHEWRRKSASVVAAAGPLDLDDVGAEIRQHLRAGRSCKDAGEIENLDVLERSGRGTHCFTLLRVGNTSGFASREH